MRNIRTACRPFLIGAVLILLVAASCGHPADSADGSGKDTADHPAGAPGRRVVIIALDGATWDVAMPLVERGEMPVLAELMADGAWGLLETIRPTWTPVIFTTMATGRDPADHGITTYVSDQGVPLTSNLRKVRALWEILSERQMPVLFFSWPVTWPAEPVLGAMISDRWHRVARSQTYPPELWHDLDKRLASRETSASVPPQLERLAAVAVPDRVSPFLHGAFERTGRPGGARRRDQQGGQVERTRRKVEEGLMRNVRLDFEVKAPFFIDRLASDRPRLAAVYINPTDMAQHFFGGADDPLDPQRLDRNAAGREAVNEMYRVYDRFVGMVVEGVRSVKGYENAVFVLLSDHGIDPACGAEVRLLDPGAAEAASPLDRLNACCREESETAPTAFVQAERIVVDGRPEGLFTCTAEGPDAGWLRCRFHPGLDMAGRSRALNRLALAGVRPHPGDVFLYYVHNEAPPGLVVISGGGVAAGQRLRDMSVREVAPTLLALLGLPVAKDMTGRPASLLLEGDGPAGSVRLTASWIETYETSPRRAAIGEAIASPEDDAVLEDLKALGYIE